MDEGLCGRWGVPLMTMMYLASAFHEEHGTEAIQRAARAGDAFAAAAERAWETYCIAQQFTYMMGFCAARL